MDRNIAARIRSFPLDSCDRHDDARSTLVSIDDTVDSDEWRQLMPMIEAGNRFLSAAWFHSWESVFLDSGNWHGPARYITVRIDGELAGVLPLAQQRVAVIRFLSLAGYYMPYRDLPVRADLADQVIDALALKIAEIKGVAGVRLGPMERSSPNLRALRSTFERAGWTTIEVPRGELLYLTLPDNVAEYRPLVRGRAKKANYFLRRLERKGQVAIRLKTRLPSDETRKLLSELQKIESESWVAASGEPRFMGEQNFRFWMLLLGDDEINALVKVWILYMDEEPVSFCLTLDAAPIRYQLVNGYSESVKQHSTGHILFQQMITEAIETGIERICFGQGDPGHKGEWGATPESALIDLIAFKPGPIGKLAAIAHAGAAKLKRAG